MNTQTELTSRLHNPWLNIARVVWIVIVSLIMVLFSAGLLIGLNQLRIVCTGEFCHPNQLSPALAGFNEQLDLSIDFYAWYTTITFALFGFFFFAIAWLIFWQRSDDGMALFVSLWMVIVGANANAVIPALVPVTFIFVGEVFVLLVVLFPDGCFVPRWIRWLVLIWVFISLVNQLNSPLPSRGISSGPPSPFLLVGMLIGIGSQVYRYVRVSTPIQRQQTKWAVFGFAGWFACLVALLLILAIFPVLRHPGLPGFIFDRYAFTFAGLLPILFIPAGIGIAILRYRLWDIDIIIRRTLVYGTLTALLALLFYAFVTVLGALVSSYSGVNSTAVYVVSTLAIAALFSPLRRRIQDTIDRRFYRRKYDAEKALAAFGLSVREEVNLENLSLALLGVVEDTLQPEQASLWLLESGVQNLQAGRTYIQQPSRRLVTVHDTDR